MSSLSISSIRYTVRCRQVSARIEGGKKEYTSFLYLFIYYCILKKYRSDHKPIALVKGAVLSD